VIDWVAMENGLHAVIAQGLGLPGNKVLWSGQKRKEPGEPWAAITVDSFADDGRHWEYQDTDGHHQTGYKKASISVSVYCADPFGPSNPIAIANKLVSYSRSPLGVEMARTVGIGSLIFDSVKFVGSVVGVVDFEPRSILSGSFLVLSDILEPDSSGTWIETAGVVGTIGE
jgi:hypothetical protein